MIVSMSILNDLNIQRKKHEVKAINSLINKAVSSINNTTKKDKGIFYNESSELNYSNKNLVLNNYNEAKLYSIEVIKASCVNYGLRFLNIKHYKAELPYNTYIKCAAHEIEANRKIDFYIISQVSNFKIQNPLYEHLIFADAGNDNFYLIDVWGIEYPFYKKLVVLPFRNPNYLLLSILVLSIIIGAITPTSFINRRSDANYFCMLRISYFFSCFIAVAAVLVYYVIGFRKNLNNGEWNNPSLY